MCNVMDPRLVGFAHDMQNMVPPMLKNIENLHILDMKYAKRGDPPIRLLHAACKTWHHPRPVPSPSLVCKDKIPGGIVLLATKKLGFDQNSMTSFVQKKKEVILPHCKMRKVDICLAMWTIFLHILISARGPPR